jgi:hypothetical protein
MTFLRLAAAKTVTGLMPITGSARNAAAPAVSETAAVSRRM